MKEDVSDKNVPSSERLRRVRGIRDVAWRRLKIIRLYAWSEHTPFSILEKIAGVCLVKVIPETG